MSGYAIKDLANALRERGFSPEVNLMQNPTPILWVGRGYARAYASRDNQRDGTVTVILGVADRETPETHIVVPVNDTLAALPALLDMLTTD